MISGSYLKSLRGFRNSVYENGRFACIQNEAGTIFIYNTTTGKIENKISCAGVGDYEGITINDNTVYVVCADGTIYEVNINISKASAKQYKTPLKAEHNIEGLCFDRNNNFITRSKKR